MQNRFMDVIVDKFGKDVEVALFDDEHFGEIEIILPLETARESKEISSHLS